MIHPKNSLSLGCLTLLWIGSIETAEIISNEFDSFEAQCRASLDEPWRTIPWKTSLIKAQNVAAREKKPIFIWAMDGHPLGCT